MPMAADTTRQEVPLSTFFGVCCFEVVVCWHMYLEVSAMEEWEVCLDRLQCSYDGCALNEVIRRL